MATQNQKNLKTIKNLATYKHQISWQCCLEAQENEKFPYFAKLTSNIKKNHELMAILIIRTKDSYKIPTKHTKHAL